MPNPDPNRKTAHGTKRIAKADASQDVNPKQRSFHEAATVHDRIRRWQTQDVAEASDPDVLSIRSQSRSEACCTPALSRSSSPANREPATTPRKRSTRWVQQQNKQWAKQRRSVRDNPRSSTNHKHVQEDVAIESRIREETPTAEYVRNESLYTRNVNSSRAEREERRRRRREARARSSGGRALVNDGIRVYAWSESHPPSEHINEDQLEEPVQHEDLVEEMAATKPSRTHHQSASHDHSQRSSSHCESSENQHVELAHEDSLQHQPSKYAQTLGQAPKHPEATEQPKTRKQAILSKTREILIGKGDAPPALLNRIPSIQAWLEEQPDPFFEEKDGTTPLAEDVPKPLKPRSHRKKASTEATVVEVEDPNKIWDSLSPTPVQQREACGNSRSQQRKAAARENETSPLKEPPKRRLFSFEASDDPSKGEESTPPPPGYAEPEIQSPVALRRRGAKTSRVKSTGVSETTASPAIPVEQSNHLAEGQESPVASSNHPLPKKESSQISRSHDPDQQLKHAHDRISELDRAPSVGLKRKLTTHEDLISVLSQPRARRSTRSVRSLRDNRGPPSQSVLQESLETMRQEEQKYVRELRTLVDGVTPVLLQSLLSKTDAAATVGLFSDNNKYDANLTQPIIQMGIALERLKNLHNRLPLQEHEIDKFLSWASSAHKYYADYVKWWRLGFQEVMINLAPLDNSQTTEEDMLARDPDGDMTGVDGQKVDVAYLQKRPLVKIKRFSKLISTIKDVFPGNDKAVKLADMYADLTEKAKQRHSEEQGRLEDEAAVNIDTTRARDIKTMAPITSVEVNKRRKVRARDCFNMTLYHSTGQRMDCRVEIILRDDPHPNGVGGDILICQVDEESKWLLFAPINLSNVSSRRDESSCDLVVMIKGIAGISETWYELLALKAEVPEAVVEWLHMIGSSPLPPKLNCAPSVISPEKSRRPVLQELQSPISAAVSFVPLNASALANLPSDVDVPIGEPSVVGSRTQKQATEAPAPAKKHAYTISAPTLNLGGGLRKRDLPGDYQQSAVRTGPRRQTSPSTSSQAPSSTTSSSNRLPLRAKAPPKVSITAPSTNLDSKYAEPLVPPQQYPPQTFHPSSSVSGLTYTSRETFSTESELSRQLPHSATHERKELSQNVEEAQKSWLPETPKKTRSGIARQARAAEDMAAGTKLNADAIADDRPRVKDSPPRSHAHTKATTSTPLTETIREQWAAIAGRRRKHRSASVTPGKSCESSDLVTDEYPTPRAKPHHDSALPDVSPPEQAPPLPLHRENPRTSSSPQPLSPLSPTLPRPGHQSYPGQTSPLKQEYQPSDSASGTESENDTDATSDTSEEDFGSELKDQATPLVAVRVGGRRVSQLVSKPLPSVPSSGTRTLEPSDSASNGPYRRAPPLSAYAADKKRRTIAMVCSWSDRGTWAPIQDDECSIVISPGLVQAFPMSAAHSQPMGGAEWEEGEQSPSSPQQSPLVEFELTPVVPLRKGTALDITIRSPPTPNSAVRTTNNVMFRSRTIQECEKLYQLINWARCNNPTYAQLARSRAREEQVTFASNVPQGKSRSWFSFGSREKSSYRASSRPPSSVADTAASGSSATSAFSALKRFGKNSPFSLTRSSVIHRPGLSTVGDSLYSSSNGTGPGSGTSTPAPSQAGFVPGLDGPNVPATSAEAANGGGMVNNMKVHLFLRQGQKWEQLGQCLLAVLPAAIDTQASRPATPESSTPPGTATLSRRTSTMGPPAMSNSQSRHFRLPSSSNTPHKIHGDGREKRILITSAKRKEVVMLDEVLGESCFEKIMQTGIAVNVWKEDAKIQEHGGVLTGRSRTYMIQFKTSTEASWVFNMCGTYRYGRVVPGT